MTDLTTLSRQDLHMLACDAIAADGRKPSISSVREWTLKNAGKKLGSDTDTQADLNLWWKELLQLKMKKPMPDVPEPVAQLFRDVWVIAMDAALAKVADERALIAQEKVQAAEQVTAAHAERDQVKHELAVAQEQIAAKDTRLAELRAELDGARADLREREAKIDALNEATARREREVASDAQRVQEEHQRALQVLEGVKNRALHDIDVAREETKRFKVDADALRAALAQAQDKAMATITQLRAELEQARGREAAMQEQLTHLRAERVKKERPVVTTSPGLRLRAAGPVRKKLR